MTPSTAIPTLVILGTGRLGPGLPGTGLPGTGLANTRLLRTGIPAAGLVVTAGDFCLIRTCLLLT